jgi:hypothetical protein
MRFSIITLLLATAVIALGAAAIVHRTSLWTNLVVTLAVGITVGCTITRLGQPEAAQLMSAVCDCGLGVPGDELSGAVGAVGDAAHHVAAGA